MLSQLADGVHRELHAEYLDSKNLEAKLAKRSVVNISKNGSCV